MKLVCALALFTILLLAGCARTGLSGDRAANLAYCGDEMKLKLKIERDRCYHSLALLQKDESICEYIKGGGSAIVFTIMDDAVTKNIRNDCYYEVAVLKAEKKLGSAGAIAAICDNIKGESDESAGESGNMLLRDLCFYDVAVEMLAPEVCDRISEGATREYREEVTDPATGETSYAMVLRSAREVCKKDIEQQLS